MNQLIAGVAAAGVAPFVSPFVKGLPGGVLAEAAVAAGSIYVGYKHVHGVAGAALVGLGAGLLVNVVFGFLGQKR